MNQKVMTVPKYILVITIFLAIPHERRCEEKKKYLTQVRDEGRCPVVNLADWKVNIRKHNCKFPYAYHCALNENNRFIDACAKPKFCGPGKRPVLLEDGDTTIVSCRDCQKNYYMPFNYSSVNMTRCEYPMTNCRAFRWKKCNHEDPLPPFIKDNLCRCDARGNYVPFGKHTLEIGGCFRSNGRVDCYTALEHCPEDNDRLLNYTCSPKCKSYPYRPPESDECPPVVSMPPTVGSSRESTSTVESTTITTTVTMLTTTTEADQGPPPGKSDHLIIIIGALIILILVLIVVIYKLCQRNRKKDSIDGGDPESNKEQKEKLMVDQESPTGIDTRDDKRRDFMEESNSLHDKLKNIEERIQSTTPSALLDEERIQSTTPSALLDEERIQSTTPSALLDEERIQSTTPSALLDEERIQSTTPSALLDEERIQSTTPSALLDEERIQSTTPSAPLDEIGMQIQRCRENIEELQLLKSNLESVRQIEIDYIELAKDTHAIEEVKQKMHNLDDLYEKINSKAKKQKKELEDRQKETFWDDCNKLKDKIADLRLSDQSLEELKKSLSDIESDIQSWQKKEEQLNEATSSGEMKRAITDMDYQYRQMRDEIYESINKKIHEMTSWLENTYESLDKMPTVSGDHNNIKESLDKHTRLDKDIAWRKKEAKLLAKLAGNGATLSINKLFELFRNVQAKSNPRRKELEKENAKLSESQTEVDAANKKPKSQPATADASSSPTSPHSSHTNQMGDRTPTKVTEQSGEFMDIQSNMQAIRD